MIRFTTGDSGQPRCEAEIKGRYGVYLDTDSLIELAKGPAPRRERFLDALRERGTLLFSITSAIEVGGLQGDSAKAAEALLTAVGPRWVPLELSPWRAAEREHEGAFDRAPVSDWFMTAFVQQRMSDLSSAAAVVDFSAETFFDLSAVVAWAQQERDEIRAEGLEMDRSLREFIARARARCDTDPAVLDELLPPIPFAPQLRATFVMTHVLRTLVAQAKSHHLKKNDALDFCHAVMATAYSSVATLDKAWKVRIATLPQPCSVARVFYRPEVDALVDLLTQLPPLEPALLG